jgi:F-box domain
MSPQLLDLSAELLIQILAHLSLRSISACALTSRRLHNIISGSQYLRYLVRTEKAGVNDPFLTVLPIPERMAVLEKWERSWHVPDLRRPALQCVVPSDISVSMLRYEIHGGYLVVGRRFPMDDRPAGYSYIYLHDAVERGSVSWNEVDLLQPLSVVSYCFNVEEYNLVVMLVSCASILSSIPPPN